MQTGDPSWAAQISTVGEDRLVQAPNFTQRENEA